MIQGCAVSVRSHPHQPNPRIDQSAALDGNKPLSEMNCDDLNDDMNCDIISRAIKPLEDKMDVISRNLKKLEVDIVKNTTNISQLKDDYKEHKKKTTSLDADISVLKQVIVEQQGYLERIKSKDLAKNLIVTGIPIKGLKIGNKEYDEDNEIALY